MFLSDVCSGALILMGSREDFLEARGLKLFVATPHSRRASPSMLGKLHHIWLR